MNESYNKFNSVDVDITGADPSAILDALVRNDIIVQNIRNIDLLTVRVMCLCSDERKLAKIIEKYGGSYKVYKNRANILYFLKKRKVLLIGLLIFATILLTIPSRIFFVRVTGNTSVPTAKIIEEAGACGIRFGASRRTVRSEKIKNGLLASVPQLKWLGINTKGCVATISVREKSSDELANIGTEVGSIVACTDGIIQTCTATSGTVMCAVGDAVLAGETLVSGYVDCGIVLKEVKAEAEITALTARTITAVAPMPKKIRTHQIDKKRKISLRVGKKLINFFKDSGISDSSCVKIYTEEWMLLPGGFRLPLSLIVSEYLYFDTYDGHQMDCQTWMPGVVKAYLESHLQACQVISENTRMDVDADSCVFYGEYICLENIGQFVNEEIVDNDRQTN